SHQGVTNGLSAPLLSVVALCGLFGLYGAFLGIDHLANDLHHFRQSQTAITILYFKDHWSLLDYWTPVMGKPWAIPFELPIYQFLAALFFEFSGLSLETSARLV